MFGKDASLAETIAKALLEVEKARYSDPANDCPYWRAPCKKHNCRFYIQVHGTDPNTGQPVNKWDCAMSWLPMLTIENSQQQRQTGAAVESFRNEMVKQNDVLIRRAILGQPAKAEEDLVLIGNNHEDDNGKP